MLGMSYYRTGVYSQVPVTLGEVTANKDALTQNAYLHMGLAYLQLADKNKARMAFEQAAASDADLKIKEQASYNNALCIHETSYSAFGESVTLFENFQNGPAGMRNAFNGLECGVVAARVHIHLYQVAAYFIGVCGVGKLIQEVLEYRNRLAEIRVGCFVNAESVIVGRRIR